jgi:hypothetical protein
VAKPSLMASGPAVPHQIRIRFGWPGYEMMYAHV